MAKPLTLSAAPTKLASSSRTIDGTTTKCVLMAASATARQHKPAAKPRLWMPVPPAPCAKNLIQPPKLIPVLPNSASHSFWTKLGDSITWSLLKLIGLFNETLRELTAMKFLWEIPVRLDNDRLVAFLGAEPHTPWDEAVATTLRGLGSIQ